MVAGLAQGCGGLKALSTMFQHVCAISLLKHCSACVLSLFGVSHHTDIQFTRGFTFRFIAPVAAQYTSALLNADVIPASLP